MDYLESYYLNYDEEGRLLSRHGQVEYRTTMRCIRRALAGDRSSLPFLAYWKSVPVPAGTASLWQRKVFP